MSPAWLAFVCSINYDTDSTKTELHVQQEKVALKEKSHHCKQIRVESSHVYPRCPIVIILVAWPTVSLYIIGMNRMRRKHVRPGSHIATTAGHSKNCYSNYSSCNKSSGCCVIARNNIWWRGYSNKSRGCWSLQGTTMRPHYIKATKIASHKSIRG